MRAPILETLFISKPQRESRCFACSNFAWVAKKIAPATNKKDIGAKSPCQAWVHACGKTVSASRVKVFSWQARDSTRSGVLADTISFDKSSIMRTLLALILVVGISSANPSRAGAIDFARKAQSALSGPAVAFGTVGGAILIDATFFGGWALKSFFEALGFGNWFFMYALVDTTEAPFAWLYLTISATIAAGDLQELFEEVLGISSYDVAGGSMLGLALAEFTLGAMITGKFDGHRPNAYLFPMELNMIFKSPASRLFFYGKLGAVASWIPWIVGLIKGKAA